MAKKQKAINGVSVAFEVPSWHVEEQVNAAIQSQVEKAVDETVASTVAVALGNLVDKISRERVAKEIERVMAEGWPMVNSYGEKSGCGTRSLKDRIGEILNHKDSYNSSQRWIDELVKKSVDAAIKAHFDSDIKAARESFKSQVDGVLAAVVKKAVGDHLGVKV